MALASQRGRDGLAAVGQRAAFVWAVDCLSETPRRTGTTGTTGDHRDHPPHRAHVAAQGGIRPTFWPVTCLKYRSTRHRPRLNRAQIVLRRSEPSVSNVKQERYLALACSTVVRAMMRHLLKDETNHTMPTMIKGAAAVATAM